MRKISKYLLIILIIFISNIVTYNFVIKPIQVLNAEKDNEKYLLFLEQTLSSQIEHFVFLKEKPNKSIQTNLKLLNSVIEIENKMKNNQKSVKLFMKLIAEFNLAIKKYIDSE
ncbi:hypothetical protein EELLY_v1c02850 [Entomoplasma ellychniae]|uniref:Uncharacterized protein n=1 Tax=Entomoplasma ellychniae TaxID=2114 RepID=A0A8E2UAP3_9MOLU|nr:hypothetical protein [Entomoplasma ellychniae]PPE04605.1 hypothetical protein EELLY_v1c02850 [Entomoplasma ellychniae]